MFHLVRGSDRWSRRYAGCDYSSLLRLLLLKMYKKLLIQCYKQAAAAWTPCVPRDDARRTFNLRLKKDYAIGQRGIFSTKYSSNRASRPLRRFIVRSVAGPRVWNLLELRAHMEVQEMSRISQDILTALSCGSPSHSISSTRAGSTPVPYRFPDPQGSLINGRSLHRRSGHTRNFKQTCFSCQQLQFQKNVIKRPSLTLLKERELALKVVWPAPPDSPQKRQRLRHEKCPAATCI